MGVPNTAYHIQKKRKKKKLRVIAVLQKIQQIPQCSRKNDETTSSLLLKQ